MSLTLTSSAFAHEQPIPPKYSGIGRDISPPLAWSGAPQGTASYALIMDDPDAPRGTWIHWVMYNIPPQSTSLPEAVPTTETLPDGSIQGTNTWPKPGYGGPNPPSGTHRYYFKLYALDTILDAPVGLTKEQLLKAMAGHILAQAELMGTFTKRE